MCGRYSITTAPEAMRRLFRFANPTPNLQPRYNAAPSQELPVVRLDKDGNRELAMLRWGLLPAWADDPKIAYSMINARAETVPQKPAFRTAFRKRRCLVPADGFYEWQALADGKQPWRITMEDGGPFAMAGLWERWEKGDGVTGPGPAVESFTIIVTEANQSLKPIHDRMPVILDPSTYDMWLESKDTTIPLALLQSPVSVRVTAYRVSKRVNAPKNDDAAVIEPAE